MTVLSLTQWAAGAGLICFGLDELARNIGGIIEPSISAFSERFRHLPGSQLAAGLPAGITMQGRRGCLYLRRRRLAGLFSLPQAAGFGFGMAIGMMLPAAAVFLLPPALRFPVLIAGMLLKMLPGASARQSAGQALVGFGCCWIGFVVCRESAPAGVNVPATVLAAIALAGAFVFRTPVPLWLILASLHTARPAGTATFTASAAIAGWALAVLRIGGTMRIPFRQNDSLLDYRDLRFPERALQAALQEVRRLAEGLAESTRQQLPGLMDGNTSGLRHLRDTELAMNEFKPAAQRYLSTLAKRKLNERQVRLLLFLHRCVSDLERIGDHVDALAESAVRQYPPDDTPDENERRCAMLTLVASATALIDTVAESITGHGARKEASSLRILEGCETTRAKLASATDTLNRNMDGKTIPPPAAIRYRELLSHFGRMISHIQAIALVEKDPDFWIDPDAVHERGRRDRAVIPPRVPPAPYLERLNAWEAEP